MEETRTRASRSQQMETVALRMMEALEKIARGEVQDVMLLVIETNEEVVMTTASSRLPVVADCLEFAVRRIRKAEADAQRGAH